MLNRRYMMNPRGHEWALDENGEVDHFAHCIDVPGEPPGHNGPQCVKCGYYFCEHCQSGPSKDCPPIVFLKETPTCGS